MITVLFIVLGALLSWPQRDAESIRPYEKCLSYEIFFRYEYPTPLRDIKHFKRRNFNKFDDFPGTSVNVYVFEETEAYRYQIFMTMN